MRRVSALLWVLGLVVGSLMLIPGAGQAPVALANVPNEQPWSVVNGTCQPAYQGAVFANAVIATGATNYCGGSGTSFDTVQIFPPNVLRDEASNDVPCEGGRTSGTCYRMWYVGVDTNAVRRVGYAVSPDGVTWTRVPGTQSGGSVFTGSNVSGRFDEIGVTTNHVIRYDGLYRMWYTGVSSDGSWVGFGYATSSDGINWDRRDDPVLTPRTTLNVFDNGQIIGPFVIVDQASTRAPCDGGRTSGICFRMWYEGIRAGSPASYYVGYALSPDGINWTVVNGPEDLGSVLDGSGFADPDPFDSNTNGLAAVIKDGDIYRMWYQAKNFASPDVFSVGHVTSTDGRVWVRPLPNEAVFRGTDDSITVNLPGTNDNVWVVRLLKEDLRYRMWYATSSTTDSTRFGLVEMTQGTALPGTPTVSRTGNTFTINFTTNRAIPSGGSVLITLPPNVSLAGFGSPSLTGFGTGATLVRDPAAVTDAFSGFAAREALIVRLPNGAATGAKTISFNLGAGVPSPETVQIQTFDSHKVLERSSVDLRTDLAITKTSAPATLVPGTQVTYTMTVTNNGPAAANGATVVDNFPAAVTNVTWTCSGAACSAASGSGNLNQTLGNMPSGASVTITAVGTIQSAATGNLSNTATVTAPAINTDTNTGNNSATDTQPLQPRADLAISRSITLPLTDGFPVSYTLTAQNNGPSTATDAQIVDTVSGAVTITGWTCTATSGSSCGAASGNSLINQTATLAPGGSVTYTVNGNVSSGAVGQQVTLTSIITPPAGVEDLVPANNQTQQTTTIQPPEADLAISRTNLASPIAAGRSFSYTLVAQNNGPTAVIGARVVDTVPAVVTITGWTCSATSGSSCGAASGSGPVDQALTIVPGGSVTYTVTGVVAYGSAVQQVAFASSITPPTGIADPVLANNQENTTAQVNYVIAIPIVVR